MSMPNAGPSFPPPPPAEDKGKSTLVLILGILGVVCCQFVAPVAWYLGDKEVKAIRAGLSPASGEGTAKAGMILGIVGSVILIISIIFVVFFGGLGILAGIMNSGESF